MGLFGLFGRNSESQRVGATAGNDDFFNGRTGFSSISSQSAPDTAVFFPKSFDDVQTIINTMKQNKIVIVHLNGLKTESSVRVMDFLSGAVYALNGGVYELPDTKNAFYFSPSKIEIHR